MTYSARQWQHTTGKDENYVSWASKLHLSLGLWLPESIRFIEAGMRYHYRDYKVDWFHNTQNPFYFGMPRITSTVWYEGPQISALSQPCPSLIQALSLLHWCHTSGTATLPRMDQLHVIAGTNGQGKLTSLQSFRNFYGTPHHSLETLTALRTSR